MGSDLESEPVPERLLFSKDFDLARMSSGSIFDPMKPQHILHLLLVLCLLGCKSFDLQKQEKEFETILGAITRGDTSSKQIALVFTGHEFAEGGPVILKTLKDQQSKATFFFTGDFYRNPDFSALISSIEEDGHYLGAHSDKHLLYCDWTRWDSLLVTKEEFARDLFDNYEEMEKYGIRRDRAPYFLPPYEWYNDSISQWTEDMGLQLINFTHGTLSHADYTTPSMPGYRSSDTIYRSIMRFGEEQANGLKGFILLIHIGAGPEREDKFYLLLDRMMRELKGRGYRFVRIDELLD